jgi:cytochrome c
MTNKMMSLSLGTLLLAGAAWAQDKKDPVAAGKEVFEQCSVCHNADSDEKKMGPGLKGLMKKAKMKNGKAPTDENVRAIIKAGGNGMPAYEDMLSKDELTQLMAYLKTL